MSLTGDQTSVSDEIEDGIDLEINSVLRGDKYVVLRISSTIGLGLILFLIFL